MAIVGKPRNYFKKFLFTIECEGIGFAGFQSASAVEAEVAVIETWEGGALAAETSPGRYKTSILTLTRGATKDLDLWKWFKEVANIAANGGAINDSYKRDCDIVQKDRDGTELRRWTIHKAWPTKFTAGEWDNNADANTMETIALTYKWFDPDDDQATADG